jgi:enoyl-CoA hydratase/carnithine racemase
MSEPIVVAREQWIETWTLNLPEQRNPITGLDVIDAFEAVVRRVNADAEVRVVILTGAGSAFSTGGNVKHMIDGEGMFGLPPQQQMDAYRDGVQRIPRALAKLRVPLIAAVNGPAVGAGCDLACMADLRIASADAWFAESFVKLGIIAGDGGAWFLPRAVGEARAREMAFTGDRISAETALEWGLVSQVVAPDELLAAAKALAERIAVNPPLAVRMTKQLMDAASTQTLDEVLDLSASMQALAHQTDDHREALDAARDRRAGVYRGK